MSDSAGTVPRLGRVRALLDSDIVHSFVGSATAVFSAGMLTIIVLGSMLSPWIAPHDPFDMAQFRLLDSMLPPAFVTGGNPTYLLGTDDQGRDLLSAMMHGMRISLLVAVASILFAATVGTLAGLVAGYAGGLVDAVLMRIADVQLTFPSILVALLVNGVVTVVLSPEIAREFAIYVIILSIGISRWPQFARAARGSTLVERGKEYVQAAIVIGISRPKILLTHILPNVMGPILVIGTLNIGLAVLDEATLSFLGLGLPPNQPSIGTLIRTGQDFLFTGGWWISVLPGVALVCVVLSINLLGDWLRDALNPRLR